MTGWVNRFANVGDIAMEVAGNTASRVILFFFKKNFKILIFFLLVMLIIIKNWLLLQFRQAKTEMVSASKAAYRFLFCVTNNVKTDMDDSNREESPIVQVAWLKNLVTNGVKPSTSSSSETENHSEVVPQQHI